MSEPYKSDSNVLKTKPSNLVVAADQPSVLESGARGVPVADDAFMPLPTGKSKTRILGLACSLGVLATAVVGWVLLLPMRIEVIHPTFGAAVEAVYATGSVEASVTIPVAGRVAARLAEMDVDEGTHVKQGQVLAKFEDADVQSTVAQAQVQERLAKATFDRTAKLLQTGAATQAAYDMAYASWQEAKASTDHAVAQAGFLQVVAPSDGVVIRRDGEVGQLVPAGQTIFWISAAAPRITSNVDEEDISRVQIGQRVLIHADAFPSQVFDGTVSAITAMGDPIARSYRVRIALDAETPLMIGMTTQTNIVIAEHDHALLVPTAAVDAGAVWSVRGGRLVRQAVTLGIKGTERTEITAGLEETDAIVSQADATLREGMRVRASADQ